MNNNGERIHRFVFEGPEKRRLDQYLADRLERISRNQAQKLIAKGLVLLNQQTPKPATKLCQGDRIEVILPAPIEIELKAQPIPLDILHEDPFILVVNKPAGMVVHPAAGIEEGTLVNAVLYHCGRIEGTGGLLRPGIVHRLDKETSGVMVVAKNESSHNDLSSQFKERRVNKQYVALVHGVTKEKEGRISAPIGRHPTDRKRLSINSKSGREALTNWRVSRWFNHFTFLEVSPETGRTHQIRIHLAAINHPIVGDRLYGSSGLLKQIPDREVLSKIRKVPRCLLHACRIGFRHPATGAYVEFEAPIPQDMREMIEFLTEKGG